MRTVSPCTVIYRYTCSVCGRQSDRVFEAGFAYEIPEPNGPPGPGWNIYGPHVFCDKCKIEDIVFTISGVGGRFVYAAETREMVWKPLYGLVGERSRDIEVL
jgi:hypothetical protein